MSRRDILLVALAAALTLAVRGYLVCRSPCISADGVQYIWGATAVFQGRWPRALALYHAPGYPAAIAAIYPLTHDWELAGAAVSVAAATLSVVPLAGLARLAAFDTPALAALLVGFAVVPWHALYSANVLTEGLYTLLFLLAVWTAAVGGLRERPGVSLAAGVVVGLAYLVRAEGIGLVVPLGAWLARRRDPRGIGAAAALAVAAAVVATPYVLYLHADTGHWILSRKTATVLSGALHSTSRKGPLVPQAESGKVSVGEVLAGRWRQFGEKIVIDAGRAVVDLGQAASVAFVPFILVGAVVAWRAAPDVSRLVAGVVGFYLVFLTFLRPGVRFLTACAALVLVFGGAGFGWAWERLRARRWAAPALAAAVLAVTLPQTLGVWTKCKWLRTAGDAIAAEDANDPRVAAHDLRVAYYAGGRFEPTHFPLDPDGVSALLAGEAGWLVVADGEAGPAARALIASTPAFRLVATVPVSRNAGVVRVYRIDHPR